MKKKLIALALVIVLAFSFSFSALASEGEGNQLIRDRLNALKASALGSNTAAISAISDIEGWLASNTIDIAAAHTIVYNINEAVSTAGGVTNLDDLSQTQLTSIMNNITAAANVADLRFSYNLTTGTFALTTADGTPVTSGRVSDDYIQQTGIDTTLIALLIIGITVLFGAASVVAIATRIRKKILINGVS
jgi:hypothetical protein